MMKEDLNFWLWQKMAERELAWKQVKFWNEKCKNSLELGQVPGNYSIFINAYFQNLKR